MFTICSRHRSAPGGAPVKPESAGFGPIPGKHGVFWQTLPFKDRLERRATRQEWFELQQAQEAYVPRFTGSKITYRDIAAESPFHLDESGSYLETTAFALTSEDYAITGLLNSKVLWFVARSLATRARGGYYRMKAQYVGQLPIPNITESVRQKLYILAETAQRHAQDRLRLQVAFARRIPDLSSPAQEPKLTKRLREWWTLPDFAAFRSEAKRKFKADIPLAERTDWEDWFTRDRTEIARLTEEIAQAEARIDSIVYELFELTHDEIALMESAI